MSYLDVNLNNANSWKNALREDMSRTEVDLHEVEAVIELARRTPGLAQYDKALQQVSVFFQAATKYYRETSPSELPDLVAWWERYRATVIQRFCGITPVDLRAADRVVGNIFSRFLASVPNDKIAYHKDTVPLVFGGEGGLGAYFTHPPGWNRPFAIINLPHSAFDHVWLWLALAHETGHDTYASVGGLAAEFESVLSQRMRKAVQDGEVAIPAVDLDLDQYGVGHHIQYSPEDFLALVWKNWANESQADIVGLLSCGGAALAALQRIIGFGAEDTWFLSRLPGGGFHDTPEEHPTSFVRNAFNISALRLLDGSFSSMADELDNRFQALSPATNKITWTLGQSQIIVAEVDSQEMVKSAEIAADLILNHQFAALGDKSFKQVISFDSIDQANVDLLIGPLLESDPTFAQQAGVEPRHALAAAMFAMEVDRTKADVINHTFKHFV